MKYVGNSVGNKSNIKNKKDLGINPSPLLSNGEPGRIRTFDPRLKRPVLYRTELRAHLGEKTIG